MPFTYSGDPSASDLDRVRFQLGDTDSTDPMLQDAEIQYCIDQESSFLGAIARACEAIAQRFSREASFKAGDLSQDLLGRAKHWSERADEYRKRAFSAHAPVAGGLSKSAKEAQEQDKDAVQPYFKRGMQDRTGPGSDEPRSSRWQ